MLKTLLVLVIFLSALTIISALIPQQLTTEINESFVYFLGQINNLRPISPVIVSTIFDIIYVLGNYMVLVGTYFGIKEILNMIA